MHRRNPADNTILYVGGAALAAAGVAFLAFRGNSSAATPAPALPGPMPSTPVPLPTQTTSAPNTGGTTGAPAATRPTGTTRPTTTTTTVRTLIPDATAARIARDATARRIFGIQAALYSARLTDSSPDGVPGTQTRQAIDRALQYVPDAVLIDWISVAQIVAEAYRRMGPVAVRMLPWAVPGPLIGQVNATMWESEPGFPQVQAVPA